MHAPRGSPPLLGLGGACTTAYHTESRRSRVRRTPLNGPASALADLPLSSFLSHAPKDTAKDGRGSMHGRVRVRALLPQGMCSNQSCHKIMAEAIPQIAEVGHELSSAYQLML